MKHKWNFDVSKQKVDYLKWCLVTLFGYQAFKNRKIGIIETHESIQAYAREILLKAVRTAELHGWDIIHGIIDSIYVKKPNYTDLDIQRLGREIYYNTRMELNHEGNYRWIVFLPSIVDGNIPVPSHFYGVFEDGEIKCRGIEARRKDVPKIVAEMQLKMIETLAPAKTEEEFRSLFPKVFSILKNYIKTLPHATSEDLAITRTISKTDYVNDIAQKIVIKQMQNDGFDIKPGMIISYIIKDVNNLNPLKRYVNTDSFNGKFNMSEIASGLRSDALAQSKPAISEHAQKHAPNFSSGSVFDINKYTELMIRATFSILQPFGLTIQQLNNIVNECIQLRLSTILSAKREVLKEKITTY